MAQHNHAPVDVDPAALHQAQNMWHNVMTMTKYGIIGIVALLLLMFIFLL